MCGNAPTHRRSIAEPGSDCDTVPTKRYTADDAAPTHGSCTRDIRSGKPTPHIPTPYFTCEARDEPVYVSVRSRSAVDMISESLADWLECDIAVDDVGYEYVTNADGTPVSDVVGLAYFSLSFHGLRLWFDGVVVRDLEVDVVAGLPCMEMNDILVRPSKQQIEFGDGSIFHYGLVDLDSPSMCVGSTATDSSPLDVNSVNNSVLNPSSEFSCCHNDSDTDANSCLETEPSSEFSQHVSTEPSSEFSQHVSTEPSSEFSQHVSTEPSSEFSQHVSTEPSYEFSQHVSTEPSSEFSQHVSTEPSSEFSQHVSTEPSSEFSQHVSTEPSSEPVNDDSYDSDWSSNTDLTSTCESDMCDLDFRCYSHSRDLSLRTCATHHTNSIGLHAPAFINSLNAHIPLFTNVHAPAPEYPRVTCYSRIPLNQDQMPTNNDSCSPLSMMCRNNMTPPLTDGLPDDEAPLPDEGPPDGSAHRVDSEALLPGVRPPNDEGGAPMIDDNAPLVVDAAPLLVGEDPLSDIEEPLVDEDTPLSDDEEPLVNEDAPLVVDDAPLVTREPTQIVSKAPSVEGAHLVIDGAFSVDEDAHPVNSHTPSGDGDDDHPLVDNGAPLIDGHHMTVTAHSPLIVYDHPPVTGSSPLTNGDDLPVTDCSPLVDDDDHRVTSHGLPFDDDGPRITSHGLLDGDALPLSLVCHVRPWRMVTRRPPRHLSRPARDRSRHTISIAVLTLPEVITHEPPDCAPCYPPPTPTWCDVTSPG